MKQKTNNIYTTQIDTMQQITQKVIMVRPSNFGYNVETAINNSFQTKDPDGISELTAKKAKKEFDNLVKKLRNEGVDVMVIEDTNIPIKPDAVFPNNWISLHEDGSLITYPMFSNSRRLEKREDIIDLIKQKYVVKRRYKFDSYEDNNQFLEGTGSMIIDRVNKVVYACLSIRTNVNILHKLAILKEYQVVFFNAVDRNNRPIYHTNVMMAIGIDFVIICLDSIKDKSEREEILNSFSKFNKRVIAINYDQMEHFAGNMLEVYGKNNKRLTLMSKTAFESLTKSQIEDINKTSNILHSDISTIEKYGGGSVRCMIAENFLNKKNNDI